MLPKAFKAGSIMTSDISDFVFSSSSAKGAMVFPFIEKFTKLNNANILIRFLILSRVKKSPLELNGDV
jgi:hypothetical protein